MSRSADAVRAILDGHIILSRQLAAQGHYPAIDILHSVSRLTSQIASPAQKDAARKMRAALTAYRDAKDLIQLGAYVSRSNLLDTSIRMRPELLGIPATGSCRQCQLSGDHDSQAGSGATHHRRRRSTAREGEMKNFRFPLERVLEWRRTELDLEQARFEQQMLEVTELDSERASIEAAGIRSEIEVRAWRPLTGSDLMALAAFRRHVIGKEKQIEARREETGRKLESRKSAKIEARRRCELLERLKRRRLRECQAAADRELEELAAESYLARFARRGASDQDREFRMQNTEVRIQKNREATSQGSASSAA